jgi:23S rRNA (uracil1939-C5)-methyltransferase
MQFEGQDMQTLCHKTLYRGEEIELSIDTVAFGGAGVGRYGQMVVFVPFTVDKDRVSVKIVDVKKRYATAKLKSILIPSPFRTVPRCTAYTHCGACSYQHIAYDYQLILKNGQVQNALKRIGRFDNIPIKDIIPSPQAYEYRGKADFHIATGKGQSQVVGFAARATNCIVDLRRCEIVHGSINEALSLLRQSRSLPGRQPLWSAPAEEVSQSRIIRRVKGREMVVPKNGFFQANLYLTETLIHIVEEYCNLSGNETLLDGYCGAGLFSLFLAPFCHHIYGIEVNGKAVHCAVENLNRAGINHADFYTGDMASVLRDQFIQKNISVDVVLVDPPRTGLEPAALIALGDLNPPKIVYVSCNPATLARDLRALDSFGYTIRHVQPLDMFPQTTHIETVVLLEQNPLPAIAQHI